MNNISKMISIAALVAIASVTTSQGAAAAKDPVKITQLQIEDLMARAGKVKQERDAILNEAKNMESKVNDLRENNPKDQRLAVQLEDLGDIERMLGK